MIKTEQNMNSGIGQGIWYWKTENI